MKKKWPKPNMQFVVPIYGGIVYIFKTEKQSIAASDYFNAAPIGKMTCGSCRHLVHDISGESCYVVTWKDGTRSTLIHELTHAAVFILGHAGIDIRDSAGEALCYLLNDLCIKAGINK